MPTGSTKEEEDPWVMPSSPAAGSASQALVPSSVKTLLE